MHVKDALMAVLDEDRVVYELAERGDHLRIRTLAAQGEWVVVGQWSDVDQQLAVYCVCTLTIPAARRGAVMELLTRANFGLRSGCFELDLDDGEVRFRTSADFDGIDPHPATARALLYTAVATMGRYVPALIDVVDGAAPLEALQVVERAA